MFIAREKELQALENLYAQQKLALAAVYGRSGMGKTALLQHFLQGKRGLHFTAMEAIELFNLQAFAREVSKQLALTDEELGLATWSDVLAAVAERARNEPFVLVLDEFYYLAHTAICSALRQLTQTQPESKLLIIISSSQFNFMETGLMSAKSPLAGLLKAVIPLKCVTYYEAGKFLPSFGEEEKLVLYACLGGAPQYLSLVDGSKSVAENLEQLYLRPSGFLYNATMLLLKQELRELTLYNSILATVARGTTRMNEIAAELDVAPNTLNAYLRTLCNLHLLERICPWNEDLRRTRKTQYFLQDNHYLFWYYFVFTMQGEIAVGKTENVVRKVMLAMNHYMQQGAFRKICEQYLRRQNALGRLPLKAKKCGIWWGLNPQTKVQETIDLVMAEPCYGKLLLGSCFWEEEPDAAQVEKLFAQAAIFAEYSQVYYVIFSRKPFGEELQKLAARQPALRLVSLADLFSE